LRKIINRELKLGIKRKYSVKKFPEALEKNGFMIVKTKVYQATNEYSLSQFIKLMQSISTWAYVPISQQEKIVGLLKVHYSKLLRNNKISDPVEIEVISAIRKRNKLFNAGM